MPDQRVHTSLLASLAIQRRVIWALFLREVITRFGRDNIGFLWLFLEPIFFTLTITILWTVMGGVRGGIPIAGFALSGYGVLLFYRTTFIKLASSASSNKALLYHRNVRVIDMVLSRGLLEFAASTSALVLLTLLFSSLGLMDLPVDPLKAVTGWMLAAWFIIGLGMITAYIGEASELFHRVAGIFTFITLPLTGAFTMVRWLPKSVQEILLWSPLVNCVEMLREGYFGMGIGAIYSVQYVLLVNSLTMFVGLILIRKIRSVLVDE